jgi:ligand-binding sensor domain-containing protein
MTRLRLVATALALCGAAACSKSDSGGTGPGTTGTLDITITAPVGVTPSVIVVAPSGAITTITSSQTLSALPAGNYTVIAQPGVTADPIVGIGYAGVVVGSPAAVPAGGGASATVTYTSPWAAAGHMWVANENGNTIAGFTSAQLTASGAPVPSVVLGNGTGSSSVKGALSLAVDNAGGVWFTDLTDTLRYFRASQIATSTNAAPAIRLVAPSIMSATFATLDAYGDLWVCDQFGNTLSEFTASQLTVSGTITPAVVIHASLGAIMRPYSIAFDSHGNLWVANYNGNSVVGYSPAQLAVSGSPVPFAGLSGSKGLTGVLGIAFDAGGNLWTATIIDSISKFNAADLTTIGAPAPAVIITSTALNSPYALAFDNSGALWVANYQGSNVLRYNASQLGATGAPVPAVIISKTGSSLSLTSGVAFSAPPPNLPIH